MNEPSTNWNKLYIMLVAVLAILILVFYAISRYYA